MIRSMIFATQGVGSERIFCFVEVSFSCKTIRHTYKRQRLQYEQTGENFSNVIQSLSL